MNVYLAELCCRTALILERRGNAALSVALTMIANPNRVFLTLASLLILLSIAVAPAAAERKQIVLIA